MDNCIASVVVIYFPDQSVNENLNVISNQSDLLVIVDNTGNKATCTITIPKNAKLLSNGQNIGLAASLNKGIEVAGRMGYEHIFLFDQDTIIPSGYISDMFAFKMRMDRQCPRQFALYAPNFYDRNSQTHARFPVVRPFYFRHRTCRLATQSLHGKGIIAITSGNLISYSKFLLTGPFAADYFIDFIDNEYCLRLDKLGFSVAVNCMLTINHAIGTRRQAKFLGITYKPNNHPPVRRYYIARNGIRTAILYSSPYKSYLVLILLRFMHEWLSILLFETQKKSKILAMCAGILDGLRGQMGPCSRKILIR